MFDSLGARGRDADDLSRNGRFVKGRSECGRNAGGEHVGPCPVEPVLFGAVFRREALDQVMVNLPNKGSGAGLSSSGRLAPGPPKSGGLRVGTPAGGGCGGCRMDGPIHPQAIELDARFRCPAIDDRVVAEGVGKGY